MHAAVDWSTTAPDALVPGEERSKEVQLLDENDNANEAHLVNQMGKDAVLPLVPAYALTTCTAQGQTLAALIVWFDCGAVPQGTAYVAMSRVKHLHDLLFFMPVQKHHVRPVLILY